MAAICCVVKSALQSCVPMQTPSVHLTLQCLIWQILFVTLRVGTCGTHSLRIMRVKSLKDVQHEILCASDNVSAHLCLEKSQNSTLPWLYILVCNMNVCMYYEIWFCVQNECCMYYVICFGVQNECCMYFVICFGVQNECCMYYVICFGVQNGCFCVHACLLYCHKLAVRTW